MKGFKAFDEKLMCRDFQFKVGKTYSLKGPIKLCNAGFHFCEVAFDVYNYYSRDSKTRICEVEAIGSVEKEGDKSVTDKIKIIRELTDLERLELWIVRTNSGHHNSGNYNSGYYNSGRYNSGDYNSGDYNSGHHNSGNYNSGYSNSGHHNSGHHNSGNYNSGNYNSGCSNSGNYNSGNYNSGNYNSGNYNSGAFNTTNATVRLFNKETDLLFTSDVYQKIKNLSVKPILRWIPLSSMNETEKKDNPGSKTTGGYLKNTGKVDWSGLTDADKVFIRFLPNFDATIFEQITGVKM